MRGATGLGPPLWVELGGGARLLLLTWTRGVFLRCLWEQYLEHDLPLLHFWQRPVVRPLPALEQYLLRRSHANQAYWAVLKLAPVISAEVFFQKLLVLKRTVTPWTEIELVAAVDVFSIGVTSLAGYDPPSHSPSARESRWRRDLLDPAHFLPASLAAFPLHVRISLAERACQLSGSRRRLDLRRGVGLLSFSLIVTVSTSPITVIPV